MILRRVLSLISGAALALGLVSVVPPSAAAETEPVPNPYPELISVWEPCAPGTEGPDTGVTVIVDFQTLADQQVEVRCAPGGPHSGWAALLEAGFEVTRVVPFPGALCTIDGYPRDRSGDPAICHSMPPIEAYWSYWHASPGVRWGYSGTGAGGHSAAVGSVEGWSFSATVSGDTSQEAIAPRVPPMDARGPGLVMPEVHETSTEQVDLARHWIEGQLETETNVGRLADYVNALVASGVDVTDERFERVRRELSDFSRIGRSVFASGRLTQPNGVALGRFGPAIRALQGGEAVLSNGVDLAEVAQRSEMTDPVTGGVWTGSSSFGRPSYSSQPGAIAGFAAFLLSTGGEIPQSVTEGLLGQQREDGSFQTTVVSLQAEMLDSLRELRDGGVAGLDEAIAKVTGFLLRAQREDGSLPWAVGEDQMPAAEVFAANATFAEAMAQAGHADAAARAARHLSPLQVTAELAEGTPGTQHIGAFADSLDELRGIIVTGGQRGVPVATPLALRALAAAPWDDVIPASVGSAQVSTVRPTVAELSAQVSAGSHEQRAIVLYGTDDDLSLVVDGGEFEAGESDALNVALSGLEPNTTYRAKVRVASPKGRVVDSETISFTTTEAGSPDDDGGSPGDTGGPAAPPPPGGSDDTGDNAINSPARHPSAGQAAPGPRLPAAGQRNAEGEYTAEAVWASDLPASQLVTSEVSGAPTPTEQLAASSPMSPWWPPIGALAVVCLVAVGVSIHRLRSA
ncbi:fibronectin type III domain-containing protein [Aeromicrobium sp. YIM 150415]|uniref:fibronectin type III domain-containing protein n=1 Tax=Aeromicrobium sp. YIM 150415 TaxID=2803912 RepID=UPI0019636ABC|nr:fibronectin type III domain-containing protein [Aeromicrobium sp. YIM 150415]MBM9464977.1 fibronectin type III domain-containing protein [Aeromicrobium sp. YIM 150415]